ncbi:hypothetical protein [Methylocystis parvus]|uniref:hypothetical protein n=1 Tax=Methylocystis parvus TaxID=134 RepID=UPI003C78DF5A
MKRYGSEMASDAMKKAKPEAVRRRERKAEAIEKLWSVISLADDEEAKTLAMAALARLLALGRAAKRWD